MAKDCIQIMLDYLTGPLEGVWDKEMKSIVTGIDVIDNDREVYELQRKIIDLYHSLWKQVPPTAKDHSGVGFDERAEKGRAPLLLVLVGRLVKRLDAINDGSYEVDDCVTHHLWKLLPESVKKEHPIVMPPSDFAKAGFDSDGSLASLLQTALSTWDMIDETELTVGGRTERTYTFHSDTNGPDHVIVFVVASHGYIVTAYPMHYSRALKIIETKEKMKRGKTA